jgi:DNA-binding transcriptional ArsR family regulator
MMQMTVPRSTSYDRGEAGRSDPRIGLLKELADPVRMGVIDRLGNDGPATVTRLAGELEVPLPKLSNHLRRLRKAGLVSAQRTGRQVVYALADPGLELLTPLLNSITGRVLAAEARAPSGVASRTCYGHLAGPIGVDIYRALLHRGALVAHPDGLVELGPRAADAFTGLGVKPDEVPANRQRFAFECLDATERAPHLAGALGDAVARALTERRWIEREAEGRTYALTATGKRGLARTLGVRSPGGAGRQTGAARRRRPS